MFPFGLLINLLCISIGEFNAKKPSAKRRCLCFIQRPRFSVVSSTSCFKQVTSLQTLDIFSATSGKCIQSPRVPRDTVGGMRD